MFRTGVTQNYKLVFSKGSEGTQTYVSANYMGDEGVLTKIVMNVIRLKPILRSLWLNGWMLLSILNASHGVGKGIGGLEMSGYNPCG